VIESGELARLDPLPSESALVQDYALGRDSVRKALAVLREEDAVPKPPSAPQPLAQHRTILAYPASAGQVPAGVTRERPSRSVLAG
jgi:DNA-binding transcriptional MocR family regulator